jgi:putative FmdB family regulatory protein
MPTYCYRTKNKNKSCTLCKERFEIKQSMKDKPLTKCPECGAAVQRIITSVGIRTSLSDKALLSDKNLKKHGFSKLVRDGKGYRKTV